MSNLIKFNRIIPSELEFHLNDFVLLPKFLFLNIGKVIFLFLVFEIMIIFMPKHLKDYLLRNYFENSLLNYRLSLNFVFFYFS